ncbi:MAG: pyridoxine 5'-phosphate synthase [Chitinophagaceae bacterium]
MPSGLVQTDHGELRPYERHIRYEDVRQLKKVIVTNSTSRETAVNRNADIVLETKPNRVTPGT